VISSSFFSGRHLKYIHFCNWIFIDLMISKITFSWHKTQLDLKFILTNENVATTILPAVSVIVSDGETRETWMYIKSIYKCTKFPKYQGQISKFILSGAEHNHRPVKSAYRTFRENYFDILYFSFERHKFWKISCIWIFKTWQPSNSCKLWKTCLNKVFLSIMMWL